LASAVGDGFCAKGPMTPVLAHLDEHLSRREFTALMSMTMASAALSIDMMLPAFPEMRADFGLAPDSNSVALVITAFFVGLGAGQPVWGPLSDALGRKRVLWIGLGLYGLAAAGAVLAPTLPILLAVRFLGGLGAAALRVVALGIVRDAFQGAEMAKALSYIMAVFILVPIIAPTLGTGILLTGLSWHGIFVVLAIFAAVLALWLRRLPETLPAERRIPLGWTSVAHALRTVAGHRFAMSLTVAQSAAFGFFFSFIASSQLIVSDVLDLDAWFPLIFAASAAVLGTGVLLNPRILDRYGLRSAVRVAVTIYLGGTVLFAVVAVLTGGRPPLALYMVVLVPILFAQALLIPNLNSSAMLPMGRIAGTAAAVIGSIATLGGAGLGAVIDRLYDGTVTPLALAGVAAGLVVFGTWRFADSRWERSVDPASTL
jgi:DHA1 family bicyclomycin/chloramphenicol resistance-like MFS transporter